MRTVFALFEQYDEAERAVEELISRGFGEERINVIARESTLRAATASPSGTMGALKDEKFVRERLHGIDAILAQSRSTAPAAGDVCGAGRMAATMLGKAAGKDDSPSDLKKALIDFSVPEEVAEYYRTGISDGSILVWVTTEDDRTTELANLLCGGKTEEGAAHLERPRREGFC